MNVKKPINYFQKIKFPLTAIVSILHRISGIIMFLTIGILLWILKLSLSSTDSFYKIMHDMQNVFVKFLLWGIFTIFSYHTVSGIRHMLIDFGCVKENIEIGKITANIVLLLTVILSIIIGVLLC